MRTQRWNNGELGGDDDYLISFNERKSRGGSLFLETTTYTRRPEAGSILVLRDSYYLYSLFKGFEPNQVRVFVYYGESSLPAVTNSGQVFAGYKN